VRLVSIFFLLVLFASCPSQAETYAWQKTEHTLALVSGTNVVWRIVADPAEGKPYFHPLATPGGTLLTDLRPPDHPWHRGLWWSWKFINGLNYWEEDRLTHRSQAATELVAARLQPHDDNSAELSFSINYHPWNAPPVLAEQRTIKVSAPANGAYEMDWTADFTACADVLLARTPLPGEPGGGPSGGYAGLSMRLNPATRSWVFENSEGASGAPALHGKPASWVRFSAGPDAPAVTIFDDSKNLRYPTPWFLRQDMPYFSPALLFAKPLHMGTGEKLHLHYRIFITDHDSQPKTK